MNYDRILIYISVHLFSISLQLPGLESLENGLARLPPMGWSAWGAFGCNKCTNLNDANCLSENTIKNMADSLVAKKYVDLGYTYVIIDDCWQSQTRDTEGRLQPDPNIFPNGMKALADYLHKNNLKFGIFSDLGEKTGGGFPGSAGHLETDANTFAEWEVDYLKMSAFGFVVLLQKTTFLEEEYINFGQCLMKTNRPILYSTSWPYFKDKTDYNKMSTHCNTWRFEGDATPSWDNILSIMDAFASDQKTFRIAHPGAWNDADLLVVGHEGVTLNQAQVQMAIWSIMPSSLIISANIDQLTPEMEAVLQNRKVIEVHQDPLGMSGYKLLNDGLIDVWLRPITPIANGFHSYAIAFVNRHESKKVEKGISLDMLELKNPYGYYISDLFSTSNSSSNEPMLCSIDFTLKIIINPMGVVMYKAEAVAGPHDLDSEPSVRKYPLRYFHYKITKDYHGSYKHDV